MKNYVFYLIVGGLLLGTAPFASAASITVYVSDYSDGSAPIGSNTESAPGWGSGSWQANGSSYTGVYFSPDALFGRNNVTVSELSSISFWTNSPNLHTGSQPQDWFLVIYTKPYSGSPGSSWYGNRINTEPYFSENIVEQAGEWTQWSSDIGSNRLRFFDSSNDYFGSYTDGFLPDLTEDPEYANQEILAFRIATGSGWANGFNGFVDGLEITLTDNTVGSVDFEASPPVVPLPGAAGLGLLGLGLVGVRRRFRKAA